MSQAMKALKGAAAAVPLNTSKMQAELLRGESDRAAVILLATQIENVLAERLRAAMRQLSNAAAARIFEGHAPLATFSAKIDLGWSFQLYGDLVHRDLHRIREMRNACAHSREPLEFTGELGRVALELEFYSRVKWHDSDQPLKPRTRFVLLGLQLLQALALATLGDPEHYEILA